MLLWCATLPALAAPNCALYGKSGDWKKAEACYTAALSTSTDLPTLQGAILAYRKALIAHGAEPDRIYNLALALYRTGDFRESLATLEKYPSGAAEHQALAGADWRALGDLGQALPRLKQAAAAEPLNESYRVDYALALLRGGDEAGAATELSAAALRLPRSARIQSTLGIIAYANGKSDEAVARHKKAVALEPNAADLHALLGDVYSATGALEQAATEYSAATRLAPREATYHVAQGKNLLKLHREAEAMQSFRQVLKYDEGEPNAHFQLGKLAAASGDDRVGILHLERAARHADAPPEVHYQLSQLYRRTGRKPEAANALKRFEELQRNREEGSAR